MRNPHRAITGAIVTVWVIAILANLALFGVVIWAIIRLVEHFTAGA